MKSLTNFYKNADYIKQIQDIVDQNSIISLRILDWFITNYSKKYRTMISVNDQKVDVYMNYKLMLKSFSKSAFDPFCRKNKIIFYYNDTDYIQTSCGQLCFFRWCFENNIIDFVKEHLSIIEQDMKESLKIKKTGEDIAQEITRRKRQPLSISAGRSISKQNRSYILNFD
jgi:chromosome condensin MukBEF complex kleisin-like MukF subunit